MSHLPKVLEQLDKRSAGEQANKERKKLQKLNKVCVLCGASSQDWLEAKKSCLDSGVEVQRTGPAVEIIVELIEESWALSCEEAKWAITKETPTGPQALEDRCFHFVSLWGCYFAHLTWADCQADYQAKKEEIMYAIIEIQSQSPQIVKGFQSVEGFIVLTEKEMRKALNVPRLNKGMLAGCCCVQMPKEENPSDASVAQYALRPQNHGFEKQSENVMCSAMEKEGLGVKQLQQAEKLKVTTRKGNDAPIAKAHLDGIGEDSDESDDEESDAGNEEGESQLGGQAAGKGIEGFSAACTPANMPLKRAHSLQSLFAGSNTLQTPPAKRAVVSEA
eukprot:6491976-Amphidinium_carterae.1